MMKLALDTLDYILKQYFMDSGIFLYHMWHNNKDLKYRKGSYMVGSSSNHF